MLESQAAFSRRIDVSKQRVGQFIRDRKLDGAALVKDGKSTMIDVEEALSQLKRRLDPDQRISGNARAKLNRKPSETEGLGYLAPMTAYDNPADKGAVAMGLRLVHMAGAVAAIAAIEAGASVKVAYRLREITTVNTMEMVEMFMADFGIPTDAMAYDTDAMADVDWRWAAKKAGEPYDLDAWKAWAKEHTVAEVN